MKKIDIQTSNHKQNIGMVRKMGRMMFILTSGWMGLIDMVKRIN